MEKEMNLRPLYEKFMKGNERMTHEELQSLLWGKWITTLDFVSHSDRYKEKWDMYCKEKGLDFPREIHAQDFLAALRRES